MCEHYTRPMDKPLVCMYECMQLLDTLIENDIIPRDPDNEDNLLRYVEDLETENGLYSGWVSQNIMSVATELLYDIESQNYLRGVLAERNIDMVFENILFSDDTKHLKDANIISKKSSCDFER